MFKAISRWTKKPVEMLITVNLEKVTFDFPEGYSNSEKPLLKVEWKRGSMIDYTEAMIVEKGNSGDSEGRRRTTVIID